MAEPTDDLSFALKTGHGLTVEIRRPECLDRHLFVEQQMMGSVDTTHAAFAKQLNNLELAVNN